VHVGLRDVPKHHTVIDAAAGYVDLPLQTKGWPAMCRTCHHKAPKSDSLELQVAWTHFDVIVDPQIVSLESLGDLNVGSTRGG